MILTRYLYNFLLGLFGVIALPKLLYQVIAHKKYRKNFKQRLGIGFPQIEKGTRKLIWVHAVSMGEAKAVTPLAKQLKQESPDSILLFSTITETGLNEAKKGVPEADFHLYLPFDFSWIIAPIIKRVKPDQVILCETDFWFNFLRSAKQQGAQISVVNGKISERSLNRFLKLRFFCDQVFSHIDRFCVQNPHHRCRFLQLGIPSKKVNVTGNIKFDTPVPTLTDVELSDWKKKLGIQSEDHVIVVGSTHDPEEQIVLDAFQHLWVKTPNLKVLIVPRHPERFNEVGQLLKKRGLNYSRYSQQNSQTAPIILVDAVGILRQCYQLATVAIVAGSFTPKIGGHNIVEPCGYGVPVLFGPYMHSQLELMELVKGYQAGIQIVEKELADTVEMLLSNPLKRQQLGSAGLRLTDESRGAIQKTCESLKNPLC